MTNTPLPLPGWYPDPGGQPGLRYHDGQRWTNHFTPPSPPVAPAFAAPPAPSVAVAVSSGGGANHALHAVLTFLSCGLWLPIWILVAIFDSSRASTAVAVGGAGGGAGITTSRNHKPLMIAAAVFLGLMVFGVAAQHPWILFPVFLLVAAGGAIFWKLKTAKDRDELELREQYRRDVVANRADYEHELYSKGDPRGTYGRYPPPEFLREQDERQVAFPQRNGRSATALVEEADAAVADATAHAKAARVKADELRQQAAESDSAPREGDHVEVTASGDDYEGKAGVVDYISDENDGYNIYVAFDDDRHTHAFSSNELRVIRTAATAPNGNASGRKTGRRTES